MHVLGSRLRYMSGFIALKKCTQVSHLGWDPLNETLVLARVCAGDQPLPDRYGEGRGVLQDSISEARPNPPLAYPWRKTWTQSNLTMKTHRRRMWRPWSVACDHLRQADTPTSTWSTSNSGYGRHTLGKTQRPPHRRSAE